MFEQEIELEKRQSAAIPLLLIVGLIVGLIGVAAYFVVQSRKVLAPSEAATVVAHVLQAQGPLTVSFHAGLIKERFDESPLDVRYRLLEKAGMIKVGRSNGKQAPVTLTAKGKDLVNQTPGVKHSKDADGNESYVIPLATRKLVEITSIAMSGPERATIQYSWRWEPNALGESFDASGPLLANFAGYDRVSLIDKYGVRFYHGAPTKVALTVAKGPQRWQLATE
jgi:hypothetical protein